MKKGLWHKRIPNLFAFILLALGIGVTSYLVQTGVVVVGRATPDRQPQNVVISNITNSSFTVSFTTNEKVQAALSVAEVGKNPQIFFDNRVKSGTQTPYASHFITVPNLSADTPYQFEIISDGEIFTNNGGSYTTKTAPNLNSTAKSLGEISGKTILPDGTAANDAVVIVEIPGGQILSTVTGSGGEYKLILDKVRTQDLKAYLDIPQSTQVVIKLMSGSLKTTITSTLLDASNLPTSTLSYNYNFVAVEGEEFATSSSVLKAPTPQVKFGEIKITTPTENQSFVDTRPLFRGTAVPNQTVKILIDKTPSSTIADRNGLWTHRPDSPLSAGPHKLTVQTQDAFGISRSLSANFTIFPSGTRVSQTATPSATLIPTSAPTSTPTKTPTLVPTSSQAASTPTTSLTQTPTPTLTAITNPTPTTGALTPTTNPPPTLTPTLIAVKPTATPTHAPQVGGLPPEAPGSAASVMLATFSVILITAGVALLFIL